MNDKKIVMVVDDDDSIREFVDWALVDEGYEVHSAANGALALDLLATIKPDLILLDLRMPVMDGPAFASAYRESPGPHAPIIVLSAARDGLDPASGLRVAGFLAKPFDLGSLLTIVERFASPAQPSGKE